MSDYPPDGWSMDIGVWNTDAEQDTATANTIGGSCVSLKNTAVATKLTTALFPVECGSVYLLSSRLYASSIAAGNLCGVAVYWYTQAKAFISASWASGAVLSAATTWLDYSAVVTAPGNACYAKLVYEKSDTEFTMKVDYVGLKRTSRSFLAYMGSNWSCARWATLVEFDTEDFDYGNMYDITGAATYPYAFLVPKTGVWTVQLSITLLYLDAGEKMLVSVHKNGSTWMNGDLTYSTAANQVVTGNCAFTQYLSNGDYLEPYCTHDHGSNLDIGGIDSSSRLTYFSATEWL